MVSRRIAMTKIAGALIAALVAVATTLAGQSARADAPPLSINLDDFDKLKKSVALPDGITLGYIELGNPSGRPVVLIHGFTDNARDWVPLIPFLATSERLILVDIRGHGISSKPECCYSRVDFAYDIKLLLDALKIERADIVGHSLGSIITQTFAEYWPERTRKVVLISSTGGPSQCPAPGAAPPKPADMDYKTEIAKLHDPIDPDSKFMVEWWSSPTPVDEGFLRRQRRDAAAIPVKIWLAVLSQGVATSDLKSTLPRLVAPTLLIWGAKDPIFGPEDRRTLREGLPLARVVVYPDYGHNPFWEDPRQVARDLDAFLAE